MAHYWKTIRVLIAAIAVVALALVLPAAPSAQAAGLINCVELSSPFRSCQESVWANGVELTMNFAQAAREFPGAVPSDKVDVFYVVAQQAGTPQGTLPFLHDHVVRDVPNQNKGAYSVFVRGFFVLCSEQGITSGRCVATFTSIPGVPNQLPLAKSVDDQALTSAESIEAAANSGLVVLLDTGATFLGIINPGK